MAVRVKGKVRAPWHNGMPVRPPREFEVHVADFRITRHPGGGWQAQRRTTAGWQAVTDLKGEVHVWPAREGGLKAVIAELAKAGRWPPSVAVQ